MSLAPVPSEQPEAAQSCANCSAPLAPDQRYCLACGQPASPVRLAFLDVLQAESQPYGAAAVGGPVGALPPGYAQVIEPASGPYAWLRRYSGLFGLLSVLLLAIVAGLLVGHWVTQSKAPSQQVLRVEGLPSAAATPLASAAGPSVASTTAAAASPQQSAASAAASSKAAAKTEAHEAQEAKAIENAPTPKAVKPSSTKLKKLESTHGQKHEEEINKLGAQPIETGG
ncbi:MAG TPA: zinc ribbon domain-containing protein [Solirubrobacteraceae bacterium]|nr:zinc ribbon domain-containing protein [Solirubrobacteraceae bacterium]